MNTQVTFRSKLFPREPSEPELDAGRFGKRLADFLVSGLAARGLPVVGLSAVEAGYRVEVANPDFPLGFTCSNEPEADEWFELFIFPSSEAVYPELRSFGAHATVQRLVDALDAILRAEPGIDELLWQ